MCSPPNPTAPRASDPGAAPLSIRLFGPFAVRVNGSLLPRLRSRRGQWLLALLVLRHDRSLDRAWLAETLWPDSPTSQALVSLRSTLVDLRHALGPAAERLQSRTPRTLRLDLRDCAVDLLEFDQAMARGDAMSLEAGIELYGGPLLEGSTEEWVFAERQAREQAFLAALEQLADAARLAGDRTAAERYLRRVVAVEPLRESAQRSLMQVLAEAGNRTAAGEVYRELRERLHREAHSEPDPETAGLYQQIRAAARAAGAQPSAPLPAAPDSPLAPAPLHPLPSLPTGTVTLLFTDIEGSSRLWEEQPEAMGPALAAHDQQLRELVAAHHGAVFKTMGDSVCAAFAVAADALAAALAAQRALLDAGSRMANGGFPAKAPDAPNRSVPAHPPSPFRAPQLKVRMALHTGAVESRDGDYFGAPLNRIARILQAGHGGQILLSLATQELVRDQIPAAVSLQDLGEQRLRDLVRPERLFQVLAPGLPAEFPPLRTLATFRHNLPQPLTRLIGRERELAEVAQLLEAGRLVTLTGAGGCGKSRLSLQVGANLVEGYVDGVWLVELAALADPALVPQTVAATLGIREEPGQPLTETLRDYLRAKQLLLVLDNCEHLLVACAQLSDALLRACPKLRILASSREALGITGEQTYRVPSLTVPAAQPPWLPEQLRQFEAVQLFADRAVLNQPSFALTPANAPAVALICQRLDGIPLALELAAARVKVLPAEQIAERLDDRFRLLTSGSRTVLPRQQTLRALIDWSYDLLTVPEQGLLRHLSVFAGGWDLEAAEAVCAGGGTPSSEQQRLLRRDPSPTPWVPGLDDMEAWEVLDRLTALVEKSLVIAEEQGGAARYRLLETVRQYGRDRLIETGEEEALRRRHRDWFLSLAERAEPEIRGPQQTEWLERLEREHDNLRAALAWCQEGGDGAGEAGLRLAGALHHFWFRQNLLTEGWQWLKGAVAQGAAGPARVKALYAFSHLSVDLGDHTPLTPLAVESLSLARASGDPGLMALALLTAASAAHHEREFEREIALRQEGLAWAREAKDWPLAADALMLLGLAAQFQGDLAQAKSFATEGLAIAREIGDQRRIAGQLNNLGWLVRLEGDYETARALCEESVSIYRGLGGHCTFAATLHSLGDIALLQGELVRAAALFREGLAAAHRGGRRFVVAYCLEGIGAVEAMSGQPAAAARIYGAAEALREAINAFLSPDERGDYERSVAAVRAASGESAFAAAWAEGRAMELEEAIQSALTEYTAG